MRLKFILLLFFLLWVVDKSLATDQVYDSVVYNDTTYVIYSRNILEARDYPFDPLIWKFYKDTLTRYKVEYPIMAATNYCLRGYMAEWKIKNDSLLLKNLKNGSGEEINLNYLFENRETENGVLADWFSGILRVIPVVESYYNWYDTKFITYIFVVKNGIIIGQYKRNRETN